MKKAPKIAPLTILFTTLAIIWLPGWVGPVGAETGDGLAQKKDVKPNRLINESSPYLLQHATHPVNW